MTRRDTRKGRRRNFQIGSPFGLDPADRHALARAPGGAGRLRADVASCRHRMRSRRRRPGVRDARAPEGSPRLWQSDPSPLGFVRRARHPRCGREGVADGHSLLRVADCGVAHRSVHAATVRRGDPAQRADRAQQPRVADALDRAARRRGRDRQCDRGLRERSASGASLGRDRDWRPPSARGFVRTGWIHEHQDAGVRAGSRRVGRADAPNPNRTHAARSDGPRARNAQRRTRSTCDSPRIAFACSAPPRRCSIVRDSSFSLPLVIEYNGRRRRNLVRAPQSVDRACVARRNGRARAPAWCESPQTTRSDA